MHFSLVLLNLRYLPSSKKLNFFWGGGERLKSTYIFATKLAKQCKTKGNYGDWEGGNFPFALPLVPPLLPSIQRHLYNACLLKNNAILN